jgi:hypothetical protein
MPEQGPESARRPVVFALATLAAVLCAASVLLAVNAWPTVWLGHRALAFPARTARVDKGWVEPQQEEHGIRHRALVGFSYDDAGERRSAVWMVGYGRTFVERAQAQAALARWPVGSDCQALVNPARPGEAVLEAGPPVRETAMLAWSPLPLAAAIGLAGYALSVWRGRARTAIPAFEQENLAPATPSNELSMVLAALAVITLIVWTKALTAETFAPSLWPVLGIWGVCGALALQPALNGLHRLRH